MNAIELLKADHEVVEGLFQKAEAAGPASDLLDLFAKIKAELDVHAHLEETIFYPTIQEEGSDELIELTSEALKEHIDAKNLLGEMAVSSRDDLSAMLNKLIEDVRHHVADEEGEMFPLVEAEFSSDGLDEIGDQMAAEKERFLSSAESTHN